MGGRGSTSGITTKSASGGGKATNATAMTREERLKFVPAPLKKQTTKQLESMSKKSLIKLATEALIRSTMQTMAMSEAGKPSLEEAKRRVERLGGASGKSTAWLIKTIRKQMK